MKPKTIKKTIQLVISIGLIPVNLFFIILFELEFYNVVVPKNIENYPFGGEGPVANCYYYKTAELYATHSLVWGLVFTASLVFNIYATIIEKKRILAIFVTLFVFLSFILQELFYYFYF